MNLHQVFTRNIYWPIAQKLKSQFAARAIKELDESQWKSPDELVANQWLLVKKTVNMAAKEIPFYHRSFAKAGWDFNNTDFSYEDFLSLPKVEKEDLRDHLSEFLNPKYSGRVTNGMTSGSTGNSLRLFYDIEQESYSEAGRWRAKEWWGIRPGSPHVSIWGRPFTGYKDELSQKVKSYLMNTLLFQAFDLTEKYFFKVWEKMSRFKPDIIYGYPSAIYPLAVYLEETKKGADKLGVKVIMITAESISTQQRDLIEDVFGCKTANEYGCSETGGFVYECPHGSWHMSTELTFMEFLDSAGKPVKSGQNGEIYLTHLRNSYMPLIRYRVGDLGAFISEKCSCRRGLPLMKVSVTKDSEKVKLGDGRCYSSEIFDYINLAVIKEFPLSIRQFRVIQKTFDIFHIEIVPGNKFVERAEKLLQSLIKKQLGDRININITKVPKIKREPSGKLRYFISEL